MTDSETIHGSAVAVGRYGVLATGTAGSGKSSLVLALIEDPRRDSILVADDRVILSARADGVYASAPESLRGLIEVRGIGILLRRSLNPARIWLWVEFRTAEDAPRLPDPEDTSVNILGRTVRRLILPEGCGDAALRVRVALREWLG